MNSETKIAACLDGLVTIQQHVLGIRTEQKTLAKQILEAPQFVAFRENKSDMISLELKTAITRTNLASDPLVPGGKPGVAPGARRVLRVRDLLREYPFSQGAVEMPVVATRTVNAGPQAAGSPTLTENVTLPESAITFTNVFEPVCTYSHFIPISAQNLEDGSQIQAFLDGDMRHGLALAIEHGIVNGDATPGTLNGLIANATAYTPTSPQMTNEVDIIRHAIKQVEAADFAPSAIILHPTDWYSIEIRHSASGSSDYAAGPPRLMGQPMLWGLPVVVTNTISSGVFLLGDFANACALFVRDAAVVEISRHDSSNFQKNMLTIRCQERLALVPTNAATGALVTGSL